MLVVASNPLHKRCLASSLLRKRWGQGGRGRVDDSSTRGSTRISGVPTPLPDPPWKQEKIRTRSWKDRTTRTEKEGKHEGKVISHTPYTLLRRVGGFRTSRFRKQKSRPEMQKYMSNIVCLNTHSASVIPEISSIAFLKTTTASVNPTMSNIAILKT